MCVSVCQGFKGLPKRKNVAYPLKLQVGAEHPHQLTYISNTKKMGWAMGPLGQSQWGFVGVSCTFNRMPHQYFARN
jgi:hypothetical protein